MSVLLVLTGLLAGCSGKTLKFNGTEVDKPDDVVKLIDNQWAQYVASGAKVSKADSSRCYFQTNDDVVNDSMLCGPIARLGQDQVGWDQVKLKGDLYGEKITLTAASDFSFSALKVESALYRPDGKTVDESVQLTEPDAPEAELGKLKIVAGAVPTASATSGADALKHQLTTPSSTLTFGEVKISDRVGGADDRVKAPAGSKFVSFPVTQQGNSSPFSSDVKKTTSFYIVSGTNRYEVADLKGPTVAIAVPGDGKGTMIEASYDGLSQTYDLDKAARVGEKAAGYYVDLQADAKKDDAHGAKLLWGDAQNKKAPFGIFDYNSDADRAPYIEGQGWAADGMIWLGVSISASSQLGAEEFSSYSNGKTDYKNFVATVEGKNYQASKVEKATGLFSGADQIYFQIPAAANAVQIKGTIEDSASRSSYSTKGPLSLKATYSYPSTTFSFAPQSAK
ncbi:hypothetical protein UM93_05335 [Psychromicrobium lacuslunae]|uniref:Uncharacterized protein n=1 Tax=Psychromicrobium lacuslunae TaxID=1618207 RepID=A0A0D4BXR0_9MICC|nr:hypothetical protein UM93_05335 [Psychromicrobium lacuslunae]